VVGKNMNIFFVNNEQKKLPFYQMTHHHHQPSHDPLPIPCQINLLALVVTVGHLHHQNYIRAVVKQVQNLSSERLQI
jgi:hypothetical protein